MKGQPLIHVFATILLSSGILAAQTHGSPTVGKAPDAPRSSQVYAGGPAVPRVSPAVRDIIPSNLGQETELPDRALLGWDDRGLAGTPGTEADLLAENGVHSNSTPSPIMTFEGLDGVNVTPPDTNGAVGPDHYIQMVNLSFVIYDKTGTALISRLPFTDLYSGSGLTACETNNSGNPIVLYDRLADRWFLSQPVYNSPPQMCIAISQTPDPLGAYWLYQFSVPDYPDWPKFGVWTDAYYMGTNTGFPNSYYAYAFDRANMLVGGAAGYQYFQGFPNFLMPADIDGGNPPPQGSPGRFYTFLSGNEPNHPQGVDRLAVYEFHVDWLNPANTTFFLAAELPIAAFHYTVCGFFVQDCIPQPGTSQKVDSMSWWPMPRLAYRNLGLHEAMVGNFTVDLNGADKAAIRWFELRKGTMGWELHQEGTHAPDFDNRWVGSIAMDTTGNIALGYSVSSETTLHEIRYATRLANDPLGTLRAEKTMYSSGGVHTAVNRWGGYTSMTVDPADDCTFWYTNQYDSADNSGFAWKTRVGVFKIPGCSAETHVFSDGFESGNTTAWSSTIP